MRFWFFAGLVMLLAGLSSGLRAAEPQDPFGGSGVYVPEEPEPPACRVTLQYDVIALPHLEANRLLREDFPAPAAAGALRERLKKMMAAGTARRIWMEGMLVQHRGDLPTQTTMPGPGERDSSILIEETLPGGGKGKGVILPSITDAAIRYELGPKFSAVALASPDRRQVDLELAWSWYGARDNLIWGRTTVQVAKSVRPSMDFNSNLRVPRDVWQLGAVLCPAAAEKSGVLAPVPAERWMLFVRACPDQAVDAPVLDPLGLMDNYKKERRSGGNVVEWITMDSAGAADLMAAHSGVKNDRALRQALQRRVVNGSAQLLETAWIAFSEGEKDGSGEAKLENGYMMDVPEDDLPFNLQQDRSNYPISDGPGAPARWHPARVGPVIRLQAGSWDPTAKMLKSSLELDWRAVSGFREEGTPPGRMDAHFAQIKQIVSVKQISGEPRLAGKIPLPEAPVFGAPAVPGQPRVMLIFVTPVY